MKRAIGGPEIHSFLTETTIDDLQRQYPLLQTPEPRYVPEPDDGRVLNLVETGQALGISKQRVLQLERQGLARAARWLAKNGLTIEDLLD